DAQERASHRLGLFGAVFFGEAARRPVGLRCVAAARAVEGGDVLQRDQDVAVQLDVRDVLDEAVSRQHAVLIIAAEEGDLDLLALVLIRVILHRRASLLGGKVQARGLSGGVSVPSAGFSGRAAQVGTTSYGRRRKRSLIRREMAAERRPSGVPLG